MSSHDPADRRRPLAIALVLFVLVLAAAGVWWFLSGDAPAEVDIGSAVEQVTDASDDAQADDAATTAAVDDDDAADASDAAATDDGAATADTQTSVVDTSIGEFSITESTGTFVGVRIDEELANIGATTAVIRTPEVDGAIVIEDTTLTAADIDADFTALVSDDSRRDDNIQEALNTAEHPSGTFVLTEPVELSALPTEDAPVEATATGDMTINGVTNSVDIPLQVAMTGDVAVVTGSFEVVLADYDVQAPTAPIVLSVADSGTVELQLFLTEQ